MSKQNITTDIEFKNFAAIPNVIWTWNLSKDAKILLVYYMRVAGTEGECWQSLDTICEHTGIGSHHTVTKERNNLARAGLIEINKVVGDDGGARYYVGVNGIKIWKLNAEWAAPTGTGANTLLAQEPIALGTGANEEEYIKNNKDKEVEGLSQGWVKFRDLWIKHHPTKPEPRLGNRTLRDKLNTRLRDDYFAQNYEEALVITGRSDYIKTRAWFDAGWFLQNDNNWEKCLNGKYNDNGQPKFSKHSTAAKNAELLRDVMNEGS